MPLCLVRLNHTMGRPVAVEAKVPSDVAIVVAAVGKGITVPSLASIVLEATTSAMAVCIRPLLVLVRPVAWRAQSHYA